MDKAKAMERLDAIEAEAKELRKIIIKPEKIIYDEKKIYVADAIDGKYGPYILVGSTHNNGFYRFQAFTSTIGGWTAPATSGQEAIDYIIHSGSNVHEFSDTREAFKYFLDNYKG